MPAAVSASAIAGTRFGEGSIVAWNDGKGIHTVRLDAGGALIDPLPRTITAATWVRNLVVATDGTDVLVGWTVEDGTESGSRIVVLTGGTQHTVTQREVVSLDALIWTGSRYLAITGGLHNRAEIVELDRRGFILSSASLGLSATNSDPLQWNQGFFVDGDVAWLVTEVNGQPARFAVTDANEKPQRPVEQPLGIELPFDQPLHSAGTVDGIWYVVHGRAGGSHYVSFEGSATPIAVDGFKRIDHRATRASGGEVYLFGTASDDNRILRGARISPRGRVRYFDIANAGYLTESVAMTHGVLLLTASAIMEGASNLAAPPLARIIRPLPRGERTLVRAPIVLAWGPPSQAEVSIAAHGAGFLAAWRQLAIDGMEVWTRLLDRNGGHAGEPRAIGRGATTKIASNGNIALVVSAGRGVVRARRIDAAGLPLGDAIVLDRGTTARIIGVGWDGVQFSVAWATDTQISATAVTAGGEVLFPEPVALADPRPPFYEHMNFTVSPFGALVIYPVSGNVRETWAVRLGRDLRPAGAPFLILGIDGHYPQTVWTGQEYIVTVMHVMSLRAARVSPTGQALDAPYGLWLSGRGGYHAAYGNERLILVSEFGGLATDRELRTPVVIATDYFAAILGNAAIRDDGAALFAYTAQPSNAARTLAYVRTIP